MWQIKFVSQSSGKFTYQTSEFKTKREAIKAFPSRMTNIQKVDRTYYITAYNGK